MVKITGLISVQKLPKIPGCNACYKCTFGKFDEYCTLYNLNGHTISDSMVQKIDMAISAKVEKM